MNISSGYVCSFVILFCLFCVVLSCFVLVFPTSVDQKIAYCTILKVIIHKCAVNHKLFLNPQNDLWPMLKICMPETKLKELKEAAVKGDFTKMIKSFKIKTVC